MRSAKQQQWHTRVKLRIIFINEAFIFPHFHRCISVHILILGRPISHWWGTHESWILFFFTWQICMFDTLVLGLFLSDFVRVKENVSPTQAVYFNISTGNIWPNYLFNHYSCLSTFDFFIPIIRYRCYVNRANADIFPLSRVNAG